MSASVGAICFIAKLEHLLHDLFHGSQWVELPPLHLVEKTTQLRVVRNRLLKMRLRATGCNGEHFTGKILAPALLQPPLQLQIGAMLLDLAPQLRDVLTACRLGEHDRRLPAAFTVE